MSSYHAVYTDPGHRPRRRVYFTTASIVAAIALGGVLGSALTAVFIHAQRVAYQHTVCVLRAPDDGLIQAGLVPLSGICEVRR